MREKGGERERERERKGDGQSLILWRDEKREGNDEERLRGS